MPFAIRFLTAIALLLASSQRLAGQEPATIPFAPGVNITRAQEATIDSLIRAHRDEGMALLARNDSLSRSVSARQRLRRKYHAAILAVLDAEQRSVYDAWYQFAEATFESKRRPESGSP